MDSDTPPLYVVHHPEGRVVAFDRHTPAVTLALLLSAQVGRPVVLEVGRRAAAPPATSSRSAAAADTAP